MASLRFAVGGCIPAPCAARRNGEFGIPSPGRALHFPCDSYLLRRRMVAMHLARVIGNIVSTEHNPAYEGRKLMLVEKLAVDLKPTGEVNMAIDYVGAGVGETVLVGAAPGLASVVFKVPRAPIAELIMGIVDPATLDPMGPGNPGGPPKLKD